MWLVKDFGWALIRLKHWSQHANCLVGKFVMSGLCLGPGILSLRSEKYLPHVCEILPVHANLHCPDGIYAWAPEIILSHMISALLQNLHLDNWIEAYFKGSVNSLNVYNQGSLTTSWFEMVVRTYGERIYKLMDGLFMMIWFIPLPWIITLHERVMSELSVYTYFNKVTNQAEGQGW